jgi:hypothetical protein
MTILLDLVEAVGDRATGVATDVGGVIQRDEGALADPVPAAPMGLRSPFWDDRKPGWPGSRSGQIPFFPGGGYLF